MKYSITIIALICTFLYGMGHQTIAQNTSNEIIMHPRDKEIAEQILTQFKDDYQLETNLLLIKVGQFLVGTPYVANTLEINQEEQMIVNLRELDCTTFAENCLALARTIQKKDTNFNDFVKELKYIRYRDGELNEYHSRLHYFSDWIFNNSKKNLVKDMSQEIGHTAFPNKVNFMTSHQESYPALIKSPNLIHEIALHESEINSRSSYYIPKNKLAKYEHLLQNGDILGLTTNIPGMDIEHVVIAIRIKGKTHILHASQSHKKVLVSVETLRQYINTRKSVTGIMVARPL